MVFLFKREHVTDCSIFSLFGGLYVTYTTLDVQDSAIFLSLRCEWKMKVGWRMCVVVTGIHNCRFSTSFDAQKSATNFRFYHILLWFLFFHFYQTSMWCAILEYILILQNDESTLYRLLQLHWILIERFTSTFRHSFLLLRVCVHKIALSLVYQELMPIFFLLMLHHCLNSPASEFK